MDESQIPHQHAGAVSCVETLDRVEVQSEVEEPAVVFLSFMVGGGYSELQMAFQAGPSVPCSEFYHPGEPGRSILKLEVQLQ